MGSLAAHRRCQQPITLESNHDFSVTEIQSSSSPSVNSFVSRSNSTNIFRKFISLMNSRRTQWEFLSRTSMSETRGTTTQRGLINEVHNHDITWPKDVLERHDFREIVSTFILSKKYFSPRLSRIECYRVLQKTSEKQICILLNFRYDHWDLTIHNIFICTPS